MQDEKTEIGNIASCLTRIWAQVLELPCERIALDDNFFTLGGDSLLIAQVMERINGSLRPAGAAALEMVDMFAWPTIAELSAFLQQRGGILPADQAVGSAAAQPEPIAIIGMACRFPDAVTPAAFWENLRVGRNSIRHFSRAELAGAGVAEARLRDADYIRAGTLLDNLEWFDANYFRMTRRDAEMTCPQQRLMLECGVEALEDAGYGRRQSRASTGVFIAASPSRYLHEHLLPRAGRNSAFDENALRVVNGSVATRLAYLLNLTGPGMDIDSACSSSLVATHLACGALQRGECDLALAGGVTLTGLGPEGYWYDEGGIVSPDGSCRVFDADARGTVFGSGAGLILLKPLRQALAQGDRVHAVIKGSAVNNDGDAKVGYTAPSVRGQAAVIHKAQVRAGISPRAISYLEAHGTGTRIGDPLELAALHTVFDPPNTEPYCALGAVKANIGHLHMAAGVAGVIKTALMMKCRRIPPQISYTSSNPDLKLHGSAFYIPTQTRDWSTDILYAGVSCFGIGGTNAHLVMQEAPRRVRDGRAKAVYLLPVSAPSETAVAHAVDALHNVLERDPPPLRDIAHTLKQGREEHACRQFLLYRPGRARSRGRDRLPECLYRSKAVNVFAAPATIFMFPGQGVQARGMMQGLYQSEAVFRHFLDECAECLKKLLDRDIRELVFTNGPMQEQRQLRLLQRTRYAQPVLFAFEYALARTFMHWGVQPDLMIGHSLGEYVAACLAGVFSLQEALALVCTRGLLMQSTARGSMLGVLCDREQALQVIRHCGGELAAVNGPRQCVISGSKASIASIGHYCEREGIAQLALNNRHAFHSAAMQPVLKKFAEALATVHFAPPSIPFVANVTGRLGTADEVMSADYWLRQLRHTVEFDTGISTVYELHAKPLFLELGPGRVLSSLLKAGKGRQATVFAAAPGPPEEDELAVQQALGRLWQRGTQIQWQHCQTDAGGATVSLPTYPFQRQRYWIERMPCAVSRSACCGHFAGAEESSFYLPGWQKSPRFAQPRRNRLSMSQALLFIDEMGVCEAFAEQAGLHADQLVQVRVGAEFRQQGRDFMLRPGCQPDYERLSAYLKDIGFLPQLVVHGWNLGQQAGMGQAYEADGLERTFYSILHLLQALQENDGDHAFSLKLLGSRMHKVFDSDPVVPARAMLPALVSVISAEYPHVDCQSIDLDLSGRSPCREAGARLCAEWMGSSAQSVLAYRQGTRWARTLQQLTLPQRTPGDAMVLRQSGSYVITGGLGGIGLELAHYLGKEYQASLALFTRRDFPAKAAWSSWLAEHGEEDAVSSKIKRLRALEATGARVLVIQADVCNEAQLRGALAQVESVFGAIHGLFHAAGVAGGGIIPRKTRAMAARVMAAKTQGSWAVCQATRHLDLDWVLFCSSLMALRAPAGQLDYAAANAYMDGLALMLDRQSATRYISINWDAWGETGMTAQEGGCQPQRGISPQAGCAALPRLLACGLPQVIHSAGPQTAPADPATQQHSSLIPAEGAQQTRPAPSPLYQLEQYELIVCDFWEDVLGVSARELRGDPDFFAAGGDSLLLTRLLSLLKRRFGPARLGISFADLFAHSSLESMVQLVRHAHKAQQDQRERQEVSAQSVVPCSVHAPVPQYPRAQGQLPLSAGQQGLWYLDLLEEGSARYNNPSAFLLRGKLDPQALQQAFEQIVARHQVLRSNVKVGDKGPYCEIREHFILPWQESDYSHLEQQAQQQILAEVRQQEAWRIFDLGQDLMLRLHLIKLEEQSHVLLANIHHIAFDGWSIAVLLDELAQLYAYYHAAAPCRLNEISVQFSDYAYFQESWLRTDEYVEQLAFWTQRLAGAPQRHALPFDFQASVRNPHVAGAALEFTVPANEFEAIKDFCRVRELTRFMFLQTLFAVLLARCCEQPEVVIGTPVAGRTQANIQGLIGYFVNLLPLRTSIEDNPTFDQLLQVCRDSIAESFSHQHVPFDILVRELNPRREGVCNPLFQVLFAYQNIQDKPFQLQDIQIEVLPALPALPKFDLELEVRDSGDSLSIHWLYPTDLFKSRTVEVLAQSYLSLLRAAIADPDARVQTVDIPWPGAGVSQPMAANEGGAADTEKDAARTVIRL